MQSHRRSPSLVLALLALLVTMSLMGCQAKRLPAAPPVMDEAPVTSLAGYGMELRVWPLDASAWRRSKDNAELARLYEQWLALEAKRESDEASNQNASGPDAPGPGQPEEDQSEQIEQAGPPATDEPAEAESFEAFVRQYRLTATERPGLDVLTRYSNLRGALERSAVELWSRNGLQLALVPINDLGTLRDAMGIPAPLERTWWGAATSWSRLTNGPGASNRHLETDMGSLVLPAGRMSLLGRAWAAPGVNTAVLRLELCPQFLPRKADAVRLQDRLRARLSNDDTPPNALDGGPVFERLLLRGSLPPGHALVIVPAERSQGAPLVGPAVAASTLAQALLTTIGPDGSPRQIALVVVPVLPERFGLDGG